MAKEFSNSTIQNTSFEINNSVIPETKKTVKNRESEVANLSNEGVEENTTSDESDHHIFQIIERYRSYFLFLVKDRHDAEDLEQEVKIRLWKKSKADPHWLKTIENFPAYILVTARRLAVNMMRERNQIKYVSIDDEENTKIHNMLSDDGAFESKINQEIEFISSRKQINNLLCQELTPYEQVIFELRFNEGCKPSHIADILLEEYSKILENEFPETFRKNNYEKIKSIRSYVAMDCNRLMAKFRQKINKNFSIVW